MIDHQVFNGVLPNGMRWVVASDPGAKSVSFQMLTLAGSRMDPKGKTGISHLIEHMLFDGTSTHTGQELVTQISQYGGELNAYTSNDMAVYHCKLRGKHLEHMLSFFSEILYESLFTEEDIEREKEVVLQEVNMRSGSPASSLSSILLPEKAWKDTPASEPIGGREEDIRSITRSDILHFVEQMYRPEHIVLSLAGDVGDVGTVQTLFNHYFSFTVKNRAMPTIPLATRIHQNEMVTYQLDMEQKDAMVAMAFPYMTKQLEQYTEVLSNVLMDTMNSRLFVELRTKLGLIYSVSPLSTQLRDVSLFGFSFTVDNDKEKIVTATNTSLEIIDNISVHGITTDELQRAKTYINEQRLLALEDTMTLAAFYGQELLLKGKIRPYQATITEIENLTLADIQQAANHLFSVDRLNLAVFT